MVDVFIGTIGYGLAVFLAFVGAAQINKAIKTETALEAGYIVWRGVAFLIVAFALAVVTKHV